MRAGYEHVDLGRFWQIYLTIGLFLWVGLVVRRLWPVLQQKGGKSLIYLVLVSATAIISLLFVCMGILRTSTVTVMVLLATIIFLFFAAVLFWNLVGAGLFGFMINPPIALDYMQGLNTTANHGHAALFGVYGMLGLGLTLYCKRGLTNADFWNEKMLKISFWSLNIGLALMTFLSLLPQDVLQTYVSIEKGYSFARSAEFIHSPIMQALVWARVPGDIVFSVGVLAFVCFVFRAFVPGKQKAAVQ